MCVIVQFQVSFSCLLIKFLLQTLAKHVISVHVNASNNRLQETAVEGELSLELLKKFVLCHFFSL